MEAMLLAAGLGSRLGAITKETPKCLVEVAGKPILQWNIEKLRSAGCQLLVINLFHLGDQVVHFLETHHFFGLDIRLSHEPELYNTGGGLRFAEGLFSGSSPILVLNADILCSLPLGELYQHHRTRENAATLVTRAPNDPRVLLYRHNAEGFGELRGWRNNASGDEGMVFPEDSQAELTERGFCGIQVISPVIFSHFGRPEEKRSSIFGYLDAVREGCAVEEYGADDEHWFDIGTASQLEECQSFFATHEVV
ncbi:NTP transferase domain-containing protein [bacterium]|nr:NTP transferase domain-containing protein [bacterium]